MAVIPFPSRVAPAPERVPVPRLPPARATIDVIRDAISLALGEAVEPDPDDERAVLVRKAASAITRINAIDREARSAL